MRKFYLSVIGTLVFVLVAGISKAQYSTIAAGGDFSNPATWNPPGMPTPPCIGCSITLNGHVVIDINLALLSGTVSVSNGAQIDINSWVVFSNCNITVFNNATVFVNDEVHLYTGSTITLSNTGSVINGNNDAGNPSHGSIGPGDPASAGIYYSLDAAPPLTNYDLLISPFGFGGHFPALVITKDYTFCAPGCVIGTVRGPATLQQLIMPGQAFNVWQFGASTPLPVVLSQFSASKSSGKTVVVNWATSEEVNSDYFSVERSADGTNWQSIAKISAKGFSSGEVKYTYNDPSPINAINYYRLQMVDRDGKMKYSKVASVTMDGKSTVLVVYNNPFTDQIRIKVNSATQDNLSLTLTDMLGRTYSKQFFNAQPGDNMINVVPNGVSAGLYMLNISGKNYNQTVKLVKE